MKTKKIIACLDMKDGRTVKGVQFESLRDAGDPVELARFYEREGADELVFLDITATQEKRKTTMPLIRRLAAEVSIPFTVGGGISSIGQVQELIECGASKVSINTAAFRNPELLAQAASLAGKDRVVVAIDAAQNEAGTWHVVLSGGKEKTSVSPLDWAREAVAAGAGEVLLTSMMHDGEQKGFAIDLTALLARELAVPVIASGGAGAMEHFKDVFEKTDAAAALAAGIFHFKKVSIPELKNYLRKEGILLS